MKDLRMDSLSRFVAVIIALISIAGCAVVKSYEREKLLDPILERQNQFAKQTLEQKFFSTREGSIGGAAGIGGGCGCAK
jgi:hypothetical protein